MAKKLCAVCELNKVGWLSTIIDEDTGAKICDKCLAKIGLAPINTTGNEVIVKYETVAGVKGMIADGRTYDYKTHLADVKQLNKELKDTKKKDYQELLNSFKDKNLAKYHGLYFDKDRKLILCPKTLLDDYKLMKYSDLISYNPIVREGQINKHHGITRAVVGGALLGGVGAVVGATTGHKSYSAVSNMSVVLNFKDGYTKTAKFIETDTETSSFIFKSAEKDFNIYCNFIEGIIFANNEEVAKSSEPTQGLTIQLQEVKSLFDQGIITEEDFNNKKKQLLGI